MTVHLWEHGLTWVAVPKVACTSIKHAIFHIENGRAFEDFTANGQHFHIHRIYPTQRFADLPLARIAQHDRLAVVRDPVSRLLSCCGNRVIYNRELATETARRALALADLPTNPGLEEFIDRLADYCQAVPDIAHHAAPHVTFLGQDPDYYAEVFSMRRLHDLGERLGTRVGQTVKFERYQHNGPPLDPGSLPGRSIAAIRQYYQEDYDIWGRYF